MAQTAAKKQVPECVDAAGCFLYDYLREGRLAQRLERSVYTRKVVRSNRTVPTIAVLHLVVQHSVVQHL